MAFADDNFPTLRLELTASKLSLLTALDDRHKDLQKMLDIAFERAIPHLQAQMDTAVLKIADEVVARVTKQAIDDTNDAMVDELSARLSAVFTEAIRAKLKGAPR